MNRLRQIIELESMSFKAKVNAAIGAAPLNDEQAAQWLSDMVHTELTKGLLGDAALAILDYDAAKGWLTTLFVTAITVVLQKRATVSPELESFFLSAWLDTPSSQAITEWYAFSLQPGDEETSRQQIQNNLVPIITAGAATEQSRNLLRVAMMRHVLTMAEKHPKLLVDEGLFARLT